MSSEQLWDTTMNPETRKMKRVLIDNRVETDRVVNLLMGKKVEPRKEFIIKESKKAQIFL
jgi:DNA gyrase subunit B